MITVFPVQNKTEQEELCRKCNIPFEPNMLCYRAADDDCFAGICQFYLDANGGHIAHIATAEGSFDDALFVMGRSALNFIDLCGQHVAWFEGDFKDEALLRRIGFSKNESGKWRVDLTGFFAHPCSHK